MNIAKSFFKKFFFIKIKTEMERQLDKGFDKDNKINHLKFCEHVYKTKFIQYLI